MLENIRNWRQLCLLATVFPGSAVVALYAILLALGDGLTSCKTVENLEGGVLVMIGVVQDRHLYLFIIGPRPRCALLRSSKSR